MKSPITGKEMTLRASTSRLVFRKEEFEYFHLGYYCEDSDELFTTTELDEMNLNQVYNQYRAKHNILFADEIISIRKKYGLSANRMSQILGFGPNSYRNYEKGEVPSMANANLIQTISEDSNIFRNLVLRSSDLEDGEKAKVLAKVDAAIEIEQACSDENKYVSMLFENMLPNVFSGYRKPNIQKFSEMVVYFSEKLQPTVTTMNKLLFYADFLNYKKSAYSISGARYMAHNYGPVPVRFNGLFDYITNKRMVDTQIEAFGEYVGEKFVLPPTKSFNQDLFNEIELESLQTIASTFSKCNASQIKDISHQEKAWIENEKGKRKINYNYGFDLIHV
ncbi:type II TA system antitoxin MqsA family protein [Flavobacterium chilense]|uniref:Putative zinc finger/helix-turn-helix protein, YgiT family n=1 Tax=Flavobacterium chilense TaxID=946677 RepID=A0A1M6XGL5_9FLAO|nr:type II TA system antitoxin MqsA family protein [Flavobacterium chilense]SHL05107.1 putative zinc finger/helix-turn-helix protein, YgiT family [Flavobacterium chilense]